MKREQKSAFERRAEREALERRVKDVLRTPPTDRDASQLALLEANTAVVGPLMANMEKSLRRKAQLEERSDESEDPPEVIQVCPSPSPATHPIHFISLCRPCLLDHRSAHHERKKDQRAVEWRRRVCVHGGCVCAHTEGVVSLGKPRRPPSPTHPRRMALL